MLPCSPAARDAIGSGTGHRPAPATEERAPSVLVIALGNCPRAVSQGFSRTHVFNSSTTGSSAISLEYVALSRGSESSSHSHVASHTVIFTLTGRVTVYFGRHLEDSVGVGPLDCVYIPPDVVHYVVNEGDEAMTAVVARTPDRNVVEEFTHLLADGFRRSPPYPGAGE